MPDSITPPSEAPKTGGDEKSPWEAEAKTAFAARDAAKERARAAEAKAAETASELATYKAKEKEAEEERQKAAGQFDEVLATKVAEWESKLAEKDQAISALESDRDQRTKQDRMGALVEGIQAKTKISTIVLEGLLRAAEARGTDVAPEELTEDTITDVITRLQGMAPEAFVKRDVGVPPGSPGAPQTAQDKANAAMAALSPVRVLEQRFGKK